MLYMLPIQGPVAVGVNLANGATWQKADYARKITRVALVGGSAVADAEVQLSYGTQVQMILSNFNKDNFPHPDNLYWDTSEVYCPSNTPIIVEVKKAFANAKYTLVLDIKKTRGK